MILQKPYDLGYRPERIISLVPSQSELLHDLGLEAETVGITKFCIHPSKWFNTKKRVGGTKTVDITAVHQLKPDLIIANKEENTKEQIDELAKAYPVWVTDVSNLNEALVMIQDIGVLTGKAEKALSIANQIKKDFAGLKKIEIPVNVTYFIWRNPYMTVGGDTFIHDMLEKCGFLNCHAEKTRYPVISVTDLQAACQEGPKGLHLLLLSSEPYPFKQPHIDELLAWLPGIKILLVDGEMFSWYGSRLLRSVAYFNRITAQAKS